MLVRNVGRIVDGKVKWQYPEFRDKTIKDEFEEGQFVYEDIKKLGQPKSHRQLGYYYAVILKFVHNEFHRLGHDFMGVPISLEMTDAVLKHYCCGGNSKAIMTKEEASKFIDNCISWANINLNLEIPEPIE